MTTLSIDWNKMDNLVPVVVQHHYSGQVLMLGYMNPEAVAVTLETGKVTFYSRSKQRLWTKGESSGNVLTLVNLATDCDNDALLVQAIPAGPTCHLGTTSCFSGLDNQPFLGKLAQVVAERADADPQSSYTAQLLNGNPRRVAQKVGEEGVEVALAAATNDRDNLVDECADLLYHLTVLLQQQQVPLPEVIAKLAQRHK
ncbi:bifunctional phosphoribosyl-AMP cyclohydrolase/phosphoribosyl-ATP diphosphatase HisIE [Ferrimonas sp. SCSIO 43195]|uniref:bifunctional phosphoribosyl-AMP cyclohydrolase/phosphoribosyl-ATP diphosphatase HisIE n=1 Tax=Ferrimonas sp. SCSIO 43195 TaxID=2822844 RepID=UPI002074ACA8|nr:bifunctional phosphoribosyl-AMP cyclohydrolase/phosphoribosyl-ATP diphosphatase HisIE [Ferrimonas sp. SCSIO 43195]USD39199.1 bifunctional phosphoribosyl-AMP cyclohydrolase/phosphoribosyl-ATP diphosphatase HisIE [Ferrimonas sp. SCSIO 43195]